MFLLNNQNNDSKHTSKYYETYLVKKQEEKSWLIFTIIHIRSPILFLWEEFDQEI